MKAFVVVFSCKDTALKPREHLSYPDLFTYPVFQIGTTEKGE